MPKPRSRKPDPHQAFNIGVGFHEAFIRCGTNVPDPNDPKVQISPGAPTIVNAAFASELYLKALALDRKPDLDGHDLEWLFKNALLDDERSSISAHYRESTGANPARLLSDLSRFGRAFVDWCYVYEAAEHMIDSGALFALTRSAYLAVRDLRPDWSITDYLHGRLSAPTQMGGQMYMSEPLTEEQALAKFFGGMPPHPGFATGQNEPPRRPVGWAIFNH